MQLTEKEKTLFNDLISIKLKYFPEVVIRVAGGWVRDKLLKKNSGDIDITLDGVTGEEFCLKVKKHYTDQASPIVVLTLNPSQSKHLNTAILYLGELELNFNALRSETYAETRIPQIEKGTPLSDTLRRDFTINSLFYNVNTKLIEDWTGLGFSDLTLKLIRTPLDPFITMSDDPLRALRAIRFAVLLHPEKYFIQNMENKVGAEKEVSEFIDYELVRALESKQIHQNLNVKVSTPRIYAEIKKMSDYPNSSLGFDLLFLFGYFPKIFRYEEKENKEEFSHLMHFIVVNVYYLIINCKFNNNNNNNNNNIVDRDRIIASDRELKLAFIFAYLTSDNSSNKPLHWILISLSKRVSQLSSIIFNLSSLFIPILRSLSSDPINIEQNIKKQKSIIGNWFRNVYIEFEKFNSPLISLWPYFIIYSEILHTTQTCQTSFTILSNKTLIHTTMLSFSIINTIESLSYQDFLYLKPVLSGQQIRSLLEIECDAKYVGKVKEILCGEQIKKFPLTLENTEAIIIVKNWIESKLKEKKE